MRIQIVHKETQIELREFAKEHSVRPKGYCAPSDFGDEKIKYCVSEEGEPGFYYDVEWRTELFWLDDDWEIKYT